MGYLLDIANVSIGLSNGLLRFPFRGAHTSIGQVSKWLNYTVEYSKIDFPMGYRLGKLCV